MVIRRADGTVVCPIRVGDILMTDTSSNPSSTYTGTTWEQTCVGRVPVGVNTSDSDFNAVNKQGGAKNHSHTTGSLALSVAQIPSHQHGIRNDGHGHTGNYAGARFTWGEAQDGLDRNACEAIGGNQSHNHGATGSASNNMLYQTKYFWKRLS